MNPTAENTQIASLIANGDDAETLITHPVSTTQQRPIHEEQEPSGTTLDVVRLSVGLEAVEADTDLNAGYHVAMR